MAHNTTATPGHARFDLFNPFVTCPPGMVLRRVGGKGGNTDGGKWLCGFQALRAPCTVLSLGSNNDFSFEVRYGKSCGNPDGSCRGGVAGGRAHAGGVR